MKLDVEKYLPYLEEFDLSREQKEQIIRTVWEFMGARVDIAFGLHPVQLCGKRSKVDSRPAMRSLESGNTTTVGTFTEVAANDNDVKEEITHEHRKIA